MTISIYDPRSMLQALKVMPPARAFLRRLFFTSPPQSHATETFDVDIQVEGRRAAEFVNPKGPGKSVERTGFTTYTFRPPMVAPKMPITVEDLQTRLPGENVYSGLDPDSRAVELLGNDLKVIESLIVRREELMVRDALVNGSIVCLGDDVNQTITFPTRDASLTIGTLAAAKRWDAGTSNPIRDIRDWRRAINAKTGLTPDVLILGSTALDYLMANTAVMTVLDNRRMEMGELTEELRDGGGIYYGRLAGVQIWGYDELDESSNPLIAAKTVLMGATSARCDMHYGAVGVAEGEGNSARVTLVKLPRVPESWVEREPAVRWLKVTSRPLPVPVQNNAFLTAQVIA